MWQIWLIASGIFFIIEIITIGFLFFWLGVGALITMIASFFIHNLIIQTAIFVVSSTVLILATRPIINKILSKDETVKTNVDALVGKTGIVTKNIKPLNSTGQIKVDGETWSATSENEIDIEKGTKVLIKDIKGVKAVVTPKN